MVLLFEGDASSLAHGLLNRVFVCVRKNEGSIEPAVGITSFVLHQCYSVMVMLLPQQVVQ